MANGNGRPLTGEARIEINKRNIPAALQKASDEHRQRMVAKIVADPRLLVEQTPNWVLDQCELYPDVRTMWETKVRGFLKSVDVMLHRHLTGVRGLENALGTTLKFTGRGFIYASQCPRCGDACVRIERMEVEDFHPPSAADRLLRGKKCDHKLPLPKGYWQLLLNIDFLTTAELSNAANPCPESE